ncbi:MAG: hypothetical protein JWL98_734 [Xanthomonadaceae bacterium]|nr:hypothetical protein [Xanthomonadaceae bacterium]
MQAWTGTTQPRDVQAGQYSDLPRATQSGKKTGVQAAAKAHHDLWRIWTALSG